MNGKLTIPHWNDSDKPREKLMEKGIGALSDAELIAILIGSGNTEKTAVELAREILDSQDNRLKDLATLNVEELMRFKGIGKAKAVTIVAALDLGRRMRKEKVKTPDKITKSKDAYHQIFPLLSDKNFEEFWIILLSRANNVIGRQRISDGGLSGSVVDPKKIFKTALDKKAASLILAHNHPSGSLRPSQSDIQVTKKIKEAGKLLDIDVLDHIIVGRDAYFSFADEGLI